MNELKRDSADQSRADRHCADGAAAARSRRRPDSSWMIEVTPALRNCWMTRGAWVLVVAVSDGSEAMVLTTAVMPALRRSGRR